jgi:hypothetical protein
MQAFGYLLDMQKLPRVRRQQGYSVKRQNSPKSFRLLHHAKVTSTLDPRSQSIDGSKLEA